MIVFRINKIVLLAIIITNIIPNIFQQFLLKWFILGTVICDYKIALFNLLYLSPFMIHVVDFDHTVRWNNVASLKRSILYIVRTLKHTSCKYSWIMSIFITTVFLDPVIIMVAQLTLSFAELAAPTTSFHLLDYFISYILQFLVFIFCELFQFLLNYVDLLDHSINHCLQIHYFLISTVLIKYVFEFHQ